MRKLVVVLFILLSTTVCSTSNSKVFIVKVNNLRIRENPNLQSRIVGILQKGDFVSIVSFTDKYETISGINANWVKIKSKNNNEGYVFSGFLMKGGIIKGSIMYPSDYIPKDLEVCAENLKTNDKICTKEHDYIAKDGYDGYKLILPDGEYYVYASVSSFGRAYYTECVKNDLHVNCKSHKKIKIKLSSGEIIENINPHDWWVK